MMARLVIFLVIGWAAAGPLARAQEDYLEDDEVSALRDAQDPDKRMILWMDIAQRRIDKIKGLAAPAKQDAGRVVQKTLGEYVHIMEDLDDTIADARERRVPLSKGFKDVRTRGNLFLNTLKSFDSEKLPGWKDFHYTLDEAMQMTSDEMAEAAKGNYPEVKERKPPSDLPSKAGEPSRPPATESRPPAASQPAGQEKEGPPRKSRPSQ
jgi:hypothetical protein